ncbi:hypothetical protein [Clostridium paridis]|uniref:hypothetical protein n=1 Tax=Clostridium paridis TaxID=2803863 RepID=UPI001A9C39FB|nr:hypothetical protein [Clostridium paridis]
MKTTKIDFLNSYYRKLWWQSDTNLLIDLRKYSYSDKKFNEKDLNILIDTMIKKLQTFPKESDNQVLWKNDFKNHIDTIFKENIFFSGISSEMKDAFLISTSRFIKECKYFDSTLPFTDIGQALRNVWIINIFQEVLGKKIEFTSAILGYSLLYPYTDNFLDNTTISIHSKKTFNTNLYKRLEGELIAPASSHEEQVFNLISLIEAKYNRECYPNVYNSLLYIQNAQEKSLMQQGYKSIPYEVDILDISIEKGGSSVLADGYLIDGNLSDEEEIFAYGYGFILQLCDDLQDLKDDLVNNHMTLMSQLSGKYPLDTIVSKLINLTTHIIDSSTCFRSKNSSFLKSFIKNNCILMILFAITDSKNFFSKDYISYIEQFLPYTLRYTRNLKNKLMKKLNKLNMSLTDYSLDYIIMFLLE